MTDTTSLRDADYISLSTYKRSGESVETPVWFAQQGDDIYVFSATNVGKIKRLKNSSQARVARCTVSGKITGPWLAGKAYVMDKCDEHLALTALRAKYGWLMRVTDFFSRLTGRYQQRAYICIQLIPCD